jgi:hypothetical protein
MKGHPMGIALALAICLAAERTEPPANIKALFEAAGKETARQIKELKAEHIPKARDALTKSKRGKINKSVTDVITTDLDDRKPFVFPSKQARDEGIASAEKELSDLTKTLAELEAGEDFAWPQLTCNPLAKVGDLGLVILLKADQIISPKEAIANVSWSVPVAKFFGTPNEPGSGIVWTSESKDATVLSRGISTRNIGDGQLLISDTPRLMIISGTYKYRTVVGSKTVLVIEPFDEAKLRPYMAAFAPKPTKPNKKTAP